MHRRGAAEWVGADAEVAGELKMLNRLDRGDGDRALRPGIELFPALEQGAELRVGLEVRLCLGTVGVEHRATLALRRDRGPRGAVFRLCCAKTEGHRTERGDDRGCTGENAHRTPI
jgi:hypothetical protein